MPAPIRVVHTADLHLGSPFRTFPEQAARLRDEQLALFARLVALCADRQVDVLLIAGDLFDQPVPDPRLARTVAELLDAIPETTVFIAAGNHDPAFIDSPYRTQTWPDHVHCFTDGFGSRTLPELPVRVHGAGFTGTAASRTLLPGHAQPAVQDRLNLLVLHGDLVTRGQGSVYNPVTLEQLSELGLDYTALGHRHEASGLLSAGRGFAAYSGCPMGRGFDETGRKTVQLLSFTSEALPGGLQGGMSAGLSAGISAPWAGTSRSGGPASRTWRCSAEPISLGGRRFDEHTISIDGCTDHESIADRIRSHLAAADPSGWSGGAHRILLQGETDDRFQIVPALLQQRLSQQLFHIEVADRTEPRIDLAELARESSLRGTFARLLAEQLSQAETQGDMAAVLQIRSALKHGLKAFSGEVALHADP